MSWRSVIDFDGLTSDEIFARLFLWWFGPQFAVFFFALPGRPTEFLTSIGYLGVLLTALVVWRDADGVGIERPWMWALLAGLVPLLGWWAYGRRRASGSTRDIRDYPGRAPAVVRYLHSFWGTRLTLMTHLSAEECARRLNQRRVHWTSPGQWFASQQARPLQGKADRRGFKLKWRHAMTRPGLLTQASGRYESRAGATVVRVRLGISTFDAIFVVTWLAIAILVGVPGALAEPSGFAMIWLEGWVLIGALVFLLVRWISRDDDIRLRRLILEELEAEESSR